MKHLFLIAILFLVGCASGSSILAGETKEATSPNQVKLYLETPETYEVVGIVIASSNAGWAQQDSVNYAVEELTTQAAKLGMNKEYLL